MKNVVETCVINNKIWMKYTTELARSSGQNIYSLLFNSTDLQSSKYDVSNVVSQLF